MHIGLSELGGIAGLFGALVVLWDRYYKARPIASQGDRVKKCVTNGWRAESVVIL